MKHSAFLLLLCVGVVAVGPFPASAEPAPRVKLIAHRGGVVDDSHIENSLPAIQAAVDRGYWMLEVDVRESDDGRPVAHHDATFRRYYDDPRKLADLIWDEIKQLRSTPGNHRPLLFREYAAACKGKIRLMLDLKGPVHSEAYYQSIETALRENDLLDSAFLIGIPQAKAYFKSKVRTSVNRKQLQIAIENGEDVSSLYFLFEHARGMDEKTIKLAEKAGVPLVPSINTFQYSRGERMRQAEKDIRRLRALGVTYFQIDSVYDPWLQESRRSLPPSPQR